MKRVVTIVGARPQFIKAAVLSRLIRSDEWKDKFHETLIHTGQHYDSNMSNVFFMEMDIPYPDIYLDIGNGSHGEMTGQMLVKIEKELLELKPDLALVYGDTNSTLAGALAAAKLHIPVAHVEAGLRSYWKKMPEEQNRILTDHLSDWLFCPTQTAVENLEKEGIVDRVNNFGDIMFDAYLYHRYLIEKQNDNGFSYLSKIPRLNDQILETDFILATVHREENADNPKKLSQIVESFKELPAYIILPLHPRTKKMMTKFGFNFSSNITTIEPVGYFEMLELELRSQCIITDSGGLQKEAYFAKKPCITLREKTEWTETVESGWNKLVGADKVKILEAYRTLAIPNSYPEYYGTGQSGNMILKTLVRY